MFTDQRLLPLFPPAACKLKSCRLPHNFGSGAELVLSTLVLTKGRERNIYLKSLVQIRSLVIYCKQNYFRGWMLKIELCYRKSRHTYKKVRSPRDFTSSWRDYRPEIRIQSSEAISIESSCNQLNISVIIPNCFLDHYDLVVKHHLIVPETGRGFLTLDAATNQQFLGNT